jgi:histidyl-tRNA synthetase
MEIKLNSSYKGTRILFDDSALKKRNMLDFCINLLKSYEYKEIMIPIIQMQETFAKKVGEENNNLMFNFKDRGDRDICLAPEYTAIVQQMAKHQFKYTKDVKMFYIGECFRGEKPQAGRYRQFTQFGVEVLNPSKDYLPEMVEIAEKIVSNYTKKYTINTEAKRGLDYYVGGKGFEISCGELGGQSQICGGGSYPEGIGFAIGIDRILLL